MEHKTLVRLARYVLLGAWGGHGLLWLAVFTMPYWPWLTREDDLGQAMIIMLGFSAGLLVTFSLLLVGVVLGWRALRQPAHRTWPNLALVSLSILGAATEAFLIGLFFGLI